MCQALFFKHDICAQKHKLQYQENGNSLLSLSEFKTLAAVRKWTGRSRKWVHFFSRWPILNRTAESLPRESDEANNLTRSPKDWTFMQTAKIPRAIIINHTKDFKDQIFQGLSLYLPKIRRRPNGKMYAAVMDDCEGGCAPLAFWVTCSLYTRCLLASQSTYCHIKNPSVLWLQKVLFSLQHSCWPCCLQL